MKRWGDFFRRCTPRTASSIPWFTRNSASYRCAFSMTKRPFGGAVAASSAVDRNVGTHDASRCRLPTRNREMRAEGGSAREETSQRDEGMGRVARQRRTRYLFWQPSLPPNRGDGGEGRRAGCTARRPATSHFFFVFFLYRSFLPFLIFGSSLRTLSMSPSLQEWTRRPPNSTVFGAGIFFAAMYRTNVEAFSPNFLAASRVENPLIDNECCR